MFYFHVGGVVLFTTVLLLLAWVASISSIKINKTPVLFFYIIAASIILFVDWENYHMLLLTMARAGGGLAPNHMASTIW